MFLKSVWDVSEHYQSRKEFDAQCKDLSARIDTQCKDVSTKIDTQCKEISVKADVKNKYLLTKIQHVLDKIDAHHAESSARMDRIIEDFNRRY